MPNIPTKDLPAESDVSAVESLVVNATDGTTRKLPRGLITMPIATQAQAEEGATDQAWMTPLRTKQAVTAYSLLKDHMQYVEKASPAGADTVLVADSATGGVSRVPLSSFMSSAGGLQAATEAETMALASNTVAITPAGLNAVVSARRGWQEKFGARSDVTYTVDRTSVVLEGACERVILPAADSGIEECVIVNATPRAVTIFPNEGRVASGAYFGGNTRVSFSRATTLGGLESVANLTRLTGIIVFSAASLPASSFRVLISCMEKLTGAYKGFEFVINSTVGKPITFWGYDGLSANPTMTFTSPANMVTQDQVVELIFSFDLTARVFRASINGDTTPWTTVFPAANYIVMPPNTRDFAVAGTSWGVNSNASIAFVGNIFRVALWHDWYTDLSVPANLAALRDATRPKNLGATGWRARGSWNQPASLYLRAGGTAFPTNYAPSITTSANVQGTLSGSTTTPAPPDNGILVPATSVPNGVLAEHTIQGLTAPFTLPVNGHVAFGLIEGRTQYVLMGGTA